MGRLNNEILKVIKYFSFFAYNPTLNEIYTFLEAKINKNSLDVTLKKMIKKGLIKKCKLKIENSEKYTPPQYSIPTSPRLRGASKYQLSKRKLKNWRFRTYINLISLFPQIKLVGLSGSISMMNAKEDDDIDLFIITAKNRLFIGRFLSMLIAEILGLRRKFSEKKAKNKICLNLFFDERDLSIPKFKQTLFVGHEVLQMKPIVNKEMTYERFLASNKWIFRLFPNARQVFGIKYEVSSIKNRRILNTKYLILNTINDWLESKFKSFQMKLINKHKTTEIITNTQLWFHPDDFESKLTQKKINRF